MHRNIFGQKRLHASWQTPEFCFVTSKGHCCIHSTGISRVRALRLYPDQAVYQSLQLDGPAWLQVKPVWDCFDSNTLVFFWYHASFFHSFFVQVTLLFPLFHEHASAQRVQDGEAEPLLILRDINDYNRRFSGQPRSVSTQQPGVCAGCL